MDHCEERKKRQDDKVICGLSLAHHREIQDEEEHSANALVGCIRAEVRDLIHVMLEKGQFFASGCLFMVIRQQTIRLIE